MKQNGKQLAVWGILLQLGLLFGPAVVAFSMLRSFAELSKSSKIQHEVLVYDLNHVLYATAVGMIVSLIGVVLLLIALFGAKYRASWFKTDMWTLAVLWFFILPFGTILSVIVMLYLSKHNYEFTEPSP